MSHFLIFVDIVFSGCILGSTLFFVTRVCVMLVGRVYISIYHGFVVLLVVCCSVGLLPLVFELSVCQDFPFTACVLCGWVVMGRVVFQL